MVELIVGVFWVVTLVLLVTALAKWYASITENFQLRRSIKMQEYEIKRLRAESDYAETVDCIQAAGEWATLLTTNADDGR